MKKAKQIVESLVEGFDWYDFYDWVAGKKQHVIDTDSDSGDGCILICKNSSSVSAMKSLIAKEWPNLATHEDHSRDDDNLVVTEK